MKYLYIGLSIIVLVGAFCGINGAVLDRRLSEVEEELALADERLSGGDEQGALERLRLAAERWDDHSNYFTSILIHNLVDGAQQKIRTAITALESGEEGAVELRAALEAVRSLRESEHLLLGNIL